MLRMTGFAMGSITSRWKRGCLLFAFILSTDAWYVVFLSYAQDANALTGRLIRQIAVFLTSMIWRSIQRPSLDPILFNTALLDLRHQDDQDQGTKLAIHVLAEIIRYREVSVSLAVKLTFVSMSCTGVISM